MLRISAGSDCGVLALFDIAYHAAGSPTKTKEIAARQGLSKGHIEQVFQRLKRAHLVKSTRGPSGGYHLAKAYAEITIGDIVRAVDGPVQLVFCAGEGVKSRAICERIHSCVTRDIWKASSAVLTEFLDSVTLADLCERARVRGIPKAMDQAFVYCI